MQKVHGSSQMFCGNVQSGFGSPLVELAARNQKDLYNLYLDEHLYISIYTYLVYIMSYIYNSFVYIYRL